MTRQRFISLCVLSLTLTGCGAQDAAPRPASGGATTSPPQDDPGVPTDLTEPTDEAGSAALPADDQTGIATAEVPDIVIPGDQIPRDAPVPYSATMDELPTGGTSRLVRRKGQTTERSGYSSERVYFATNRAPEEIPEAATDPDLFFSGERGELSYGACEVSIPYRRPPGATPEPSMLRLEFSQDPSKHVVLMEIAQLPEADFWTAIRARVDESPDKQLLIFVHGYCATFRDAARRTAQIAYDLNYKGPAMFFSWPAGSDTESYEKKANYLKDLGLAHESDDDLITVLAGISRYSGATKVHVVAHSMGNLVLTEALKTLDDRRGSNPPTVLFDQVAMAAPDINAREFVERAGRRVRPFSRRFTVYASTEDRALAVSSTVNDFQPLGYLNDFSRTGAQQQLFDLVDASQMSTGWFDVGHFYYGDMPEVLHDFSFVFRGVQAASLQRGLAETPPLFRLMRR